MEPRTDSSRAALLWIAALVLFQAALLRITEAGPILRYQHLLGPRAAAARSSLAVLVVGVGVALALRWAIRHRRAITGAPRAVLIAALAVVAFSAVPARSLSAYGVELVGAGVLHVTALLLAVAAAVALPSRLVAGVSAWLDRESRLPWVLATLVTVGSAALAVISYQRHPHIPDELSYLLQARYFAHGALWMPAPPVPSAFDLDLMTYEPTRWYSPFPPGWPIVLALGVRVGATWLVNPILGGLTVLVAARLFATLLERRTARLATLLFAASPWQLFLAMSLMSHTLSLLLALIAALGLARMAKGSGWAWGLAAGAAIGVVSLMRPLEGVAVAAFLGAVSLTVRWPRFRFAPSALLIVGALVAGSAGLWYNRAITGHALTFPVMAYFDRYYAPGVNALGFGPNRGLAWAFDPFPGHGLRDVIVNAALNTTAIDTELFGWAAGSLFVVVLGVLARRLDRTAWLCIGAILVIAGAHSFYWFSGGPDFGARYWFLIVFPAIALAARGISALDAQPNIDSQGRATAAALLLTLAALLVFVPWRAGDKYRSYRGMRPDVRALARSHDFRHALVLIRGHRFPDYASAAAYNQTDVTGPGTVYAWDRDARTRSALLTAYANRPVWVIDGPSVTGSDFRIVAGPLTGEALERFAASH